MVRSGSSALFRDVRDEILCSRRQHLGQRGGTSRCGLMRRSKHRVRMHNSKRVLWASTSGELNASELILSDAASTETLPRPQLAARRSTRFPALSSQRARADLRDRHLRNLRILSAISLACVSKAKWPVSKKRTTARGLSRLKASAPGGKKNGSFLPHTAKSGGLCVRKYSWNEGYRATLLL